MVYDIFKTMELAKFVDTEVDKKINRDKLIRDFVIKSDMIEPEF